MSRVRHGGRMGIRVVPAALLLVVVAACGSSGSSEPAASSQTSTSPTTPAPNPEPTAPTAPTFPGATWERGQAGDFTALDADLASSSSCVAVIKDGKLVHDAYWNGGAADLKRPVYSITKSLTSLLVGTFVGGGTLDLDASASDLVEDWRGTDSAVVTVRDLLSMTSGRRYDEGIDNRMIRTERDKTAFSVDLPQDRAPGEQWVYDNAAVQTLEATLDDTDDGVALAKERILDPLGMTSTTWDKDAAGNALTYSGVSSTCLDLARVGYLMINDGAWNGQQLVPADYVKQATTPSSNLNAAYGLLWWDNAKGTIVEAQRQAGFPTDKAPYEGRLAPNVPSDAYWAFGYGNQYIAVVPSEGVVAVRLGARPATPDRITFDTFTAGVLDALGR